MVVAADMDGGGGLGSWPLADEKSAAGPPQSQPMPEGVWNKIYALRNGQLTLLYDLEDSPSAKKACNEFDAKKKTYQYYADGYTRTEKITSWGGFVEAAVRNKADLTGLCLSPDQKKYLHAFELQNRKLTNAKLDHAQLDGMDFSGTSFAGASLRNASLRDTTGQSPDFSGVKGYLLDLSGARYTEPNFKSMNAPRSIHFRSTYDQPQFSETDWNSARLVGASLFIRESYNLDLSSALAANCLFYGMGTKTVNAYLKFSQAAFPGSCFYNLSLTAGPGYAQKGDFSPLLLDDPRLTAEEKEYVAKSGQWINSGRAMDGVKVSSEVSLPLDEKRIYSMFSEMKFETNRADNDTLFFSKGDVLCRTSFHECDLGNIGKILPESLRQKVMQASVIAPAPAAARKAGSFELPAIALDPEKISAQVDALRAAPLAEAMTIGAALQAEFVRASRPLAEQAARVFGARTALDEETDALIKGLEAYSLAGTLDAPPPPAPVREKGFIDIFINRAPLPAPPPPRDKFEDVRESVGRLPGRIGEMNAQAVRAAADADALREFFTTMEKAFDLYIGGIEAALPEIGKENRSVRTAVEMQKKALEKSRDLLAARRAGAEELAEAAIREGVGVQLFQGSVVPELETHFARASGLHQTAKDLKQEENSGPAQDEARGAFEAARGDMVALLQSARADMTQAFQDRTAALRKILGLKETAPAGGDAPREKVLDIGLHP